jgi:ribonuclease III
LSGPDTGEWISKTFGATGDLASYRRALTHGSQAADNYERLEFLGDRVLGLTIADWLFEKFPTEPEGLLTRRFHALVSGPACADVARDLGVPPHVRLGKQARGGGVANSDNVLGDVIEALIGAHYREAGFAAAQDFIRRAWGSRVDAPVQGLKHPKSALLEWAAAHQRAAPVYTVLDRSGPDHAPRFTVQAAIPKLAEASAEGTSKQDAETAAAAALLEKLGK